MKTKSTHTPGPWKVEEEKSSEFFNGLYINGKIGYGHIAYMVPSQSIEANAALISAAPELLAALKLFVEGGNTNGLHFEQAKDAILKAEGRK